MTDQRNFPVPPPPTPAESHDVLAAALRLVIASGQVADVDALRIEMELWGLRLVQALVPLCSDFARQAYGERFLDALAELAEIAEIMATESRVLAEAQGTDQ